MKTIRKELLDDLIRVIRKFYKNGDNDILAKKINILNQLSIETFGDEYHWLAFGDIVSAIVGGNGLVKRATNNDIYQVFEMLGYQVQEMEEAANEAV